MSFIVAIDGPAGSGKGTLANDLSRLTDLINIDTGATYRCVALAVIRAGLKIDDEDKIIELVDTLDINIKVKEDKDHIFLNGEDVTKEIREQYVTNVVSPISAIIPVRIKLVELQRRMAEGKDVIMEGRDIGTYVFPNADLKIYLDADTEERAKRRYKENQEKGIECTYEELLENVKSRDYTDMNKKMGALKKADDAIVINSTNLTIDEVVNKILSLRKEKMLG